MKIGNFETENNVFLAPMAGVTDLPFRKICRRYGAGLVYSEMVSAKGLYYNDKKTAYFFGCLKQCAAVTVVYDFRCGTAHIYIYYIRFYRHNFRYHFRHYISVRAEYLYRTRTFFVIYPH